MNCPHCGSLLDFYERMWDNDEEGTLQGEEHYACYRCMKSYSRKVIYTLTEAGELEE